jgi:hypothetical protein
VIKLSRPKAYGEVKPLCSSTGWPIRCSPNVQQRYYDLTEDHRYSGACPERSRRNPESLLVWLCDDCANRLVAEVQFAGTDGGDEYIAWDVACWQCGKAIETTERTKR